MNELGWMYCIMARVVVNGKILTSGEEGKKAPKKAEASVNGLSSKKKI